MGKPTAPVVDKVIYGKSNGEKLYGGDGNDTIYAGGGNDDVQGGNGNDLIYGGTGDDRLMGGGGTSTWGSDTIYGEAGNDWLTAGPGAGTLYGGADNDFLVGSNLADYLDGGTGNDTLNGGQGDDILLGGEGDDRLAGQAGADQLWGGAGADTFFYEGWRHSSDLPPPSGSVIANGVDTIHDFNPGEGDKLDLTGIDTDPLVFGRQGFVLVSAFSGAPAQLMLSYDVGTNTTTVAGDVDGDGVANLVIHMTGDFGAAGGWLFL